MNDGALETEGTTDEAASPAGAGGGAPRRKKVYVTLHRNLVREGVPYTDRETGEPGTFNVATLPAGCVIDGRDVGGYEFSPRFVDQARFEDPEEYRDIPLLADREVWLRKAVLGADGKPVVDEDGKWVKDTVVVAPQQVKDAVREVAAQAREEAARDTRGLADRAELARDASAALTADGGAGFRPIEREAE